jgi:hypothetical protein
LVPHCEFRTAPIQAVTLHEPQNWTVRWAGRGRPGRAGVAGQTGEAVAKDRTGLGGRGEALALFPKDGAKATMRRSGDRNRLGILILCTLLQIVL